MRVMRPRLRIATAGLSAAATRTVHEVVRDHKRRAVLRPAPRGAPAPLASRPGPDSAGLCHARQRSGHGPHAAQVDRAATARCTLRA